MAADWRFTTFFGYHVPAILSKTSKLDPDLHPFIIYCLWITIRRGTTNGSASLSQGECAGTNVRLDWSPRLASMVDVLAALFIAHDIRSSPRVREETICIELRYVELWSAPN